MVQYMGNTLKSRRDLEEVVEGMEEESRRLKSHAAELGEEEGGG